MATHKKEWLALGAAVPVVLYAAIQLGGVVHRRQSLKSSTTTDYPLSTSSVAEVSAWLRSRGISAATVNALARAGANGEAMCQLSMDDLLRMNVPTQDVAGICAAIVEMRSAERNQSTTATVVEAATLVITHLATPSTTMLPQHARRLMCELLEQYALLSVEQQRSAIARLAGPGPMATPRQPATREATADSTQQTMSGTAEMQLRAGAKAVEQMLDRYLKVLSSEQFRTAAPEVVERIAQEADRIQAVMDSLPDAIAGPLRAKWNAVQEALRDATPAQSAADPRASAVRAQSVAAGDVVADLKRTFSSIRAVSTLPAGERSQTLLGLQEEMNKIGARLATVSGKEEMKMASQVFLQVSELLDMAIQAEGMSAQLPDGINQDDVAGDDDEDDSTDVTERIQRVVMTLKSPAFLRLTGSERATAVATLRAEVERIRRDVSSLPTEVRAQIVQIVDAMQQMLEMVPEEEAPSVAAPSAPAGANALTPQQQKLIAMIIHIRRTVMAPAFEKAPPSQKQGLLSTATQCAETLRAIGGAEVEEIDRELVRPLLEYLEAVTAPAHADYFRQVMETLQEIGETVISPTFIEQDPATRREVATSILMQLERVCESVQSLPEREREAAKEVVSSITSILEQIVRNAPGSTEEEEDEDEEDEETSGDLNGDILKTLKHVMSQIQLPILQEASEEERGEMISSYLNVLLRLKKRCEKNASVHPTSLRVLDSLIAQLQSIVPSANAEEEEGEEVQELDATAVGDKGAMTMEVFKETFVRVLHILSNTTFSSEDEVLPPMLATEKAITAADGANLPWRDDETAFTLVSTALKAIDEVQKKIAQARHGAKAEQVLQAMVTQLTEHPPTSVADLASYFAMINELRTTQLPAAAESQLGDIQELIMRYAQQLTTAQPRSEEEANSISNNNNSTSASSHSAAASEMLMEISNRICEASAITPEELDQYERFIAALEEGMTDEDTLEALASIKEQISLERVRYANAEEAAAADGDDDEDDDDEDGDEEEDENES